MPDKKLALLRQSHTLHPHPEAVCDPLFTSGSPFFDPRDLVQVKYELLRRVRVDGYAVSEATALFALSRPTFYAAQAAWEQAGVSGLLPASTGPRHAHKLTDEIMSELQPLAKTMSAAQLAQWLKTQHRTRPQTRGEKRGPIMNGKALEPAYEAARSWALQPISRPPPAWAHIVRSGLAIWMRERPSEGSLVSPDIALIKRLDSSGLLTIVAAMIAEVCS